MRSLGSSSLGLVAVFDLPPPAAFADAFAFCVSLAFPPPASFFGLPVVFASSPPVSLRVFSTFPRLAGARRFHNTQQEHNSART